MALESDSILNSLALGAFIFHHPQFIITQEAFPDGAPPGEEASLLTECPVQYMLHVRNGLITHIHSSIPHTPLVSSAQVNMTSQLVESLWEMVVFNCATSTHPTA